MISYIGVYLLFFFFFQAEDGIRDWSVTGVQTCALPISRENALAAVGALRRRGDRSGAVRGARIRASGERRRRRYNAVPAHGPARARPAPANRGAGEDRIAGDARRDASAARAAARSQR